MLATQKGLPSLIYQTFFLLFFQFGQFKLNEGKKPKPLISHLLLVAAGVTKPKEHILAPSLGCLSCGYFRAELAANN